MKKLNCIIIAISAGIFSLTANAKFKDDFCPPVTAIEKLSFQSVGPTPDKNFKQILSQTFEYQKSDWQVAVQIKVSPGKSDSEVLKLAEAFYKSGKIYDPFNYGNYICDYSKGSKEYSIFATKSENINRD